MLEPLGRRLSPLITQASKRLRARCRIGDQGSAFTRSHLFIRIKSEDSNVAQRASFPAVDLGHDCLTHVFNHMEREAPGKINNLTALGSIANSGGEQHG